MRKKSDLSRREFLTRSAAVTGGIVSLGVLGGPGRITAQETAEFEVLTDQQAATVVAWLSG